MQRVCVVNSSGCVMKPFAKSKDNQLDTPIRMVVSGVILVAERNNH
jgi:hypothetical protein